jgi:hypothetical protein
MEFIPEKAEVNGKTVNLRKIDMPIPAVFLCPDFPGLEIGLLPVEGEPDRHMPGVWIKKEGTGCKLKFENGVKAVQNKMLLKMLMETNDFKVGRIRIDPSDKFWQNCGAAGVEAHTVYRVNHLKHPTFDDIDFEQIKQVAQNPTSPAS